jgi:hypothetical protein
MQWMTPPPTAITSDRTATTSIAGYRRYPPLPTPFALERAGEPNKMITLGAMRVMKRVEEAGGGA